MSNFNDIDIECANCGHEFRGTVWTAVHASEDPELKELLLGGELNLVQCPSCAHVAYHDHFVLYQDPEAELVVYIYPQHQQPDEAFLRKTMLKSFAEAQAVYSPNQRKTYKPIMLFGLEALVEMMTEEELRAEQSQIAQYICKEKKIPMVLLKPSEARRLGIMRTLPLESEKKSANRANILGGLKKLLAENPTLDLYAKFLKDVADDASWDLQKASR